MKISPYEVFVIVTPRGRWRSSSSYSEEIFTSKEEAEAQLAKDKEAWKQSKFYDPNSPDTRIVMTLDSYLAVNEGERNAQCDRDQAD